MASLNSLAAPPSSVAFAFASATSAISLLLAATVLGQEPTPQVVDRGPHHARWQRVTRVVDDLGRAEWTTNSWTQLESGLNYWDEDTETWTESRDVIEVTRTGAVARQGQHRVVFSTNVNDPRGAVDFEVNHQARFRASVLALRYYDPATGLTAPIGLVQDAEGELLPPNQILYRDAFQGISADVLYTLRRGTLESDVILREIPPTPTEAGLATFSDAIRIEVLTEFFESPQPTKKETILARVEDEALRAEVAEPDWLDEELDFGPNLIGQGRAFAWSAREAATHEPEGFPAVSKRWLPMEGGKNLLIEAVEYVHLFDDLAALPGKAERRQRLDVLREDWARGDPATPRAGRFQRWAAVPKSPRSLAASPVATIPARNVRRRADTTDSTAGIRVASLDRVAKAGLVIDWTSIPNGLVDYTFRSDETYYITGNAWFSGTTTIEGGTVLKFQKYSSALTNWTGVLLGGPVRMLTSAYQPAVFTAEHDNSVGESISSNPLDPAAWYGNRLLRFKDTGLPVVVEHVHIRYGREGLYFQGINPGSIVRHCQFVGCWSAINSSTTQPIVLQNVLVDSTRSSDGRAFSGTTNTPISGEHVTVRNASNLLSGVTLSLTNSIIAGVATVQSYTGVSNHQASSASGLFQTVGAGACYLAPDSPLRNAGTSDIDPTLRASLGSRTTFPPVLLSQPVLQPTTLGPVVPRDTDTPDLGYHYAALDYCALNVPIENASLTLTGGTAVAAAGTNAFLLGPASALLSHGAPGVPNVLTRYNTVQEQTTPWGALATNQFRFLGIHAPSATGANTPSASLRHTRISFPATSATATSTREFVQSDGVYLLKSFDLAHCEFSGAYLRAANPSQVRPSVNWTNNLFERCTIAFHDPPGGNVMDMSLANNLFYGGRIDLDNNEGLGTWVLRDNLFATNEVWAVAPFQSSSNAIAAPVFLSGLAAFGNGVRTGLVADFVAGPLGRYYYPASSSSSSLASLADGGSRTADAAGLFHFTTRSDQRKETNSTVDVGFHYPSTGATPVGLLASYDFEEGVGTVTADGSGNGNTGTLYNGTTWATGRRGRGVAFDGYDDHVRVSDTPALRLTQALTIAAWVRKTSETVHWAVYLTKQTNWASRNYWLGDWTDTSGIAHASYVDTSGTQRSVNSSSHLPAGAWSHVAWSWDGSTQRTYVNGVAENTSASAFVPTTSTAPVSIGGHSNSGGSMLGSMDEVRIYNRALSAAEIRTLASTGIADTDEDGLPDALEDTDGDGIVDPGESDWTQSTSGSGAALKVYTPLR